MIRRTAAALVVAFIYGGLGGMLLHVDSSPGSVNFVITAGLLMALGLIGWVSSAPISTKKSKDIK